MAVIGVSSSEHPSFLVGSLNIIVMRVVLWNGVVFEELIFFCVTVSSSGKLLCGVVFSSWSSLCSRKAELWLG